MDDNQTQMSPAMRGSMTAMVTPFSAGNVDWPRLDVLVDRQIEAGTDWLVPCGTTGESPTLSHEEHDQVLEAVIKKAGGRCPILAGTGSNSTAEAIRLTTHAQEVGADAAMLVAPYYNRPNAEGLFRHFAAVAQKVTLPIVLYNVPARTGIAIPNEVVIRLRREFPHVVAVKHATGSVDGVTELLQQSDIAVLSGDDSITWPLMAMGAVGVISVIGNLVPALMKSLVTAADEGDMARARDLHQKVHAIAEGIGGEGPNPLPIKTALALAGLIEEEFRLPLCPLSDESRSRIEEVLKRHEIL